MQKKRKIEDIVVKEVSFVDLPAIRRRFLVCKRGESTMNIIEIYKKLTGQDITEDKLTTEQKAALEILAMYDEAIPEDMAKAVGELMKGMSKPAEEKPAEEKPAEDDLEKAGAKMSKDTITRFKAGLKALVELLPEDDRDISKADPEEERENRIADKVVEKLGLAKAQDDKPDTKPDEKPDDKPKDDEGGDTPDSEVTEQLKAFSDRLAVVEKAKGIKKGLEGDENNDADPNEDLWPSWGTE